MTSLGRGRVALVTIVATIAVVAATSGTWVTGTVEDAVLGSSRLTADGDVAAPGLVGLALVTVAAVVAALVTGVVVRRVVLVLGLAAGIGATAVAARAVLAPESVLGPVAASTVGRTGSLPVEATATGYAVAGLCAAVLLALSAALGLLSVRGWPVPNRKYERTDPAGTPSGAVGTGDRGQRVRSDWEALSEGNDPTDLPPDHGS